MPAELRVLITGFIALIGLAFLATGDRARRAKARGASPAVKQLVSASPGPAVAAASGRAAPPKRPERRSIPGRD